MAGLVPAIHGVNCVEGIKDVDDQRNSGLPELRNLNLPKSDISDLGYKAGHDENS
jgi:hypothetical protein